MAGTDDHLRDLESLYRAEYAGLVRAVTVAVADQHAAEELVQEVFVQALRHWHKVVAYDQPVAWLRRVASGRAANHRRDRARRSEVATRLRALPVREGGTGPEPTGVDADLLAALLGLPERQRVTVALYYRRELTMTIPDDLDLGGAIRSAGATLDVDVDAGWRDLERRARRSPARIVVWVAAAAAVLFAIVIPVRLLAEPDASLDVRGLPDTQQTGPDGAEVAPPDRVVTDSSPVDADPASAPPRPIARLQALPACADAGDVGGWAVEKLGVRGSTATAEGFVEAPTEEVLALVPMPTDLDASCIVSLRAGDTVAFDLRAADGTSLARGASVGIPDKSVPWDLLARSPYVQGPIGSGQSASGAFELVDGEDRFEGLVSEQRVDGGRVVVLERPSIGTDPDPLRNGLLVFSRLTLGRLSEDSLFAGSGIVPEWLPEGFLRCQTAGWVPGVTRSTGDAVVYCDDAGREIRVIGAAYYPPPTVRPFAGLAVEAFELEPSEPGRRTVLVHASPTAPTLVDLPGDLAESEVLRVLQSLPTTDPRLIDPAIGVEDHRDRDLVPFVLESIETIGLTISAVPAPSRPGFGEFDLDAPDGRTLRLVVYTLAEPEQTVGWTIQGLDGWPDLLEVRNVAGIDLVLSSRPTGPDGSPAVAELHQVVFGCGQLVWILTEDHDPATAPVADEVAATLVRGLSC
jgi:DNA-directed RNA polymerase specialized sigma24 family protein